MADKTAKQGFSAIGVAVAACAACCTPPLIAFLAAASLGTFIGVALCGALGLTVAALVVVAYLRNRPAVHDDDSRMHVPVTLERKPDA